MAGGILLFAYIFVLIAYRPKHMPLVVISSAPRIDLSSVVCTAGPKHEYYYGNVFTRLMDPLLRRLNPNACRLSWTTYNTVVWCRFDHLDFGVLPTSRPLFGLDIPSISAHLLDTNGTVILYAQLIDANGAVSRLQRVSARILDRRRKYLVNAWEVPGQLEAHRGSTIRIEANNGIGTVILKVP